MISSSTATIPGGEVLVGGLRSTVADDNIIHHDGRRLITGVWGVIFPSGQALAGILSQLLWRLPLRPQVIQRWRRDSGGHFARPKFHNLAGTLLL